jgi:putative FmdB family regulatory protein
MPMYAYRCQSCGVQFDKQQKFTDRPLTRCPECRKGTVKRLLQPSAIVFKGSGWYATDHRSASGQSAAKKDADNASGASGAEKTETTPTTEKADSKPAKKEKKTATSDD